MEFHPPWVVIISKIFGQKSTSIKDFVFAMNRQNLTINVNFLSQESSCFFYLIFFSVKNISSEENFQFKIHEVAFRALILEAETVSYNIQCSESEYLTEY